MSGLYVCPEKNEMAAGPFVAFKVMYWTGLVKLCVAITEYPPVSCRTSKFNEVLIYPKIFLLSMILTISDVSV